MRLTAVAVFAMLLGACSPSDDARARQTREQVKRDAHEALQKAETGAKKAGNELDKDLHKARDNVRKALNEPEHK